MLGDDRIETASQFVATVGGPPVGELAFEFVQCVLLLRHAVFQSVDVRQLGPVREPAADAADEVGLVVDVAEQ